MDKTVNDYAIPIDVYPHLRENQTLQDAIDVIRSFTCVDYLQFSEVLILNDQRQLVGRITVREILRGFGPHLLTKDETPDFEGLEADFPNLAILWEDSFYRECRKQAGRPISEFLSPIKATVKPSDPLLKALYIMMRTHENNLPVLEENRVVGVMRIKEVFSAVCSYCAV